MTKSIATRKTAARIAVHAHVFYSDLWPELRRCIQNIINTCETGFATTFITYPEENQALARTLKKEADWENTRLIPVQNRGYDVGPFILEVINKINLDSYDYIVKLHTKRNVNFWLNFRYFKDSDWRDALLSFCITEKAFQQTLAALSKNRKIGMIASSKLINYACSDLPMDIPKHREAMKTLGLQMNHPVTVVGTMFMVRSNLLKPFQNRYTTNDFTPVNATSAHLDYGMAGKLEYHIPIAVSAQGYFICEGKYPLWVAHVGYKTMAYIYASLRTIARTIEKVIGTDNMLAIHRKFEK